jgi:hypothetical protein
MAWVWLSKNEEMKLSGGEELIIKDNNGVTVKGEFSAAFTQEEDFCIETVSEEQGLTDFDFDKDSSMKKGEYILIKVNS